MEFECLTKPGEKEQEHSSIDEHPDINGQSFIERLQSVNKDFFTLRELNVITCVLNGRSNKKIATILNISPKTVESHLKNIMLKIGCYSKQGIIDYIENSDLYPIFKEFYGHLKEKSPQSTGNVEIKSNTLSTVYIAFKKYKKPFLLFIIVSLVAIIGYSIIQWRIIDSTSYWNMPRQDHHFIGRKEFLKKLSLLLKPNSQSNHDSIICACSGLGGIGKTQLALEFARNSHHPYTLRAWFPSENINQLNQYFIDFAKFLGCSTNELTFQQAIQFVNQTLSQNPHWLIIFDNVNHYDEIAPYLPQKGGSILITSRCSTWPDKIKKLEMDVMNENESIELLSHAIKIEKAKKRNNTLELAALAKMLGYLPLALAQSSAYIQQNQIQISDYLTLFKNHSLELLADTTHPEGLHIRPISTTWNIQLEALSRANPNEPDLIWAVHVLAVCSQLSSESIPKSLLLEWLKRAHPNLQVSHEILLNKLLGLLWRHSLISMQENGDVTVHRLLQEVVRQQYNSTWLNNTAGPSKKELWYNNLLEAIHFEFNRENNTTLENEHRRMQLLPHLQSLLENCNKLWPKGNRRLILDKILLDIATVLDKGQRAFQAARPYYQAALATAELKYDRNNVNIAEILAEVANNHRNLREFELARDHCLRAVKILEQAHGESHLDVANALGTLGPIYRNLGDYKQACLVLERALKIRETFLGPNHRKIAIILSNLGNVYRDMGRFDEAFKTLERGLQILHKEYGHLHRETMPTLVNLGATYRDSGNFDKAIECLKTAQSVYEKSYGEFHPYVAIALTNLGEVYYQQENYIDARKHFERAHRINMKMFGEHHHHIINNMVILGDVYLKLKEYTLAHEFFEHAWKDYEQGTPIKEKMLVLLKSGKKTLANLQTP